MIEDNTIRVSSRTASASAAASPAPTLNTMENVWGPPAPRLASGLSPGIGIIEAHVESQGAQERFGRSQLLRECEPLRQDDVIG